jgi:hypothetical protein
LLLGVYARDEIDSAPIRDVTPRAGGFADAVGKARKEQANEDVKAIESAESETVEDAITIEEPEAVPVDQ